MDLGLIVIFKCFHLFIILMAPTLINQVLMKEIIIILPLQMFNMLLEMYNLSAIYQINPNLDKLDIFLTHLLDQ